MTIAAEFVDLRDPVERLNMVLDRYGLEFLKAISKGGPECLLCGKPLSLDGSRQAIVYGRMEGRGMDDKQVMMNFGCCRKCFRGYKSFDDAVWSMGEFIRIHFKLGTDKESGR